MATAGIAERALEILFASSLGSIEWCISGTIVPICTRGKPDGMVAAAFAANAPIYNATDGDWMEQRAKLVRAGFVQAIDNHLSRGPLRRNRLARAQ